MNNSNAAINVERTQTTVSVSKDALETIDELSRLSGVSRSRLFDMAVRRFVRWASSVHHDALREIATYETEGRTTPYVRKSSSSQLAKVDPGRSEQSEARLVPPESESLSRPGLRKTRGYSDRPDEMPKQVRRDR